jgi:hypothetical protein
MVVPFTRSKTFFRKVLGLGSTLLVQTQRVEPTRSSGIAWQDHYLRTRTIDKCGSTSPWCSANGALTVLAKDKHFEDLPLLVSPRASHS